MPILIDTQGLLPINQLWRMVIKFIFDKDHCGESTQYIIDKNINAYAKLVDEYNKKVAQVFGSELPGIQEVGTAGSVADEIAYQIMMMSKYLVMDENGELEYKKETYRLHKIDYRKAKEFRFAFPEMVATKRELAQAQHYLEVNKRDQPELYEGTDGPSKN